MPHNSDTQQYTVIFSSVKHECSKIVLVGWKLATASSFGPMLTLFG